MVSVVVFVPRTSRVRDKLEIEVERRTSSSRLAARGPLHHRQASILDLFIAAAAEEAGLPVLHHDPDFELIAEVTGQPVRAIVPLGSLD